MDLYYFLGILMLSGIALMSVLGLSLLTGFTGLFCRFHKISIRRSTFHYTSTNVAKHLPSLPCQTRKSVGYAERLVILW
jgi:branched-chain amino acid transport system permease protein